MALERLIITLNTGEQHEVIPNLADTLAFESALRKNRQWGELKDNALKMNPYRAWCAARRASIPGIADLTWEQFLDATQSVLVKEAEDEEPEDEEGPLEVPGVGEDIRPSRPDTSLPALP